MIEEEVVSVISDEVTGNKNTDFKVLWDKIGKDESLNRYQRTYSAFIAGGQSCITYAVNMGVIGDGNQFERNLIEICVTELERLTKENLELDAKVEEFDVLHQDKTDELDELQLECQNLREELDEARDTINCLRDDKDSAEAELDELRSEIRSLVY